MRPFPSSRIDSPFRPPGHEPPLSPPPLLSFLSFLSPSFSLTFSLFLFKYVFFFLAISLFSYVYSFFFLPFLSAFRLSLSSLYLPRAIYPSIHPFTYPRTRTHAYVHALTLLALSIILSHFLSLYPFSLSSSLAPRGSFSSRRRPSSTPHPHQPHVALSVPSWSYENYVTRSIRAFLVPLSFLIFLLWISQSALPSAPVLLLAHLLPRYSSPLRCTALPNIISGVPADLPADPERELERERKR